MKKLNEVVTVESFEVIDIEEKLDFQVSPDWLGKLNVCTDLGW